ncbi:hypothetical protein [Psychrobacter sp. I-STPA10]|uniref:hypothetical protein n=1 Tax=Psychrobacter sp. I-STPA10 TaxID=2585769 RepID=UPI001E546FB1|nr:hypothetical protein [Psychrobacter sp. I-STPA10]
MNKLLGVSILGLAAVLAGCGGDSDSSGNTNKLDYKNFGKILPDNTCPRDGFLIKVPKEGCTFSIQYPSRGEDYTYKADYTCKDNQVIHGNSYGYSLSFGRYNISCKQYHQ